MCVVNWIAPSSPTSSHKRVPHQCGSGRKGVPARIGTRQLIDRWVGVASALWAEYNHEMAPKEPHEQWKLEPDEHDYPAALSYLSLVSPPASAEDVVSRLRSAEIQHFKAKDLMRASRLELLSKDNFHVAADLQKVRQGKPLSPVLLVRGQYAQDLALTIADGYHRICASYTIDENADIPCRLVDWSG